MIASKAPGHEGHYLFNNFNSYIYVFQTNLPLSHRLHLRDWNVKIFYYTLSFRP